MRSNQRAVAAQKAAHRIHTAAGPDLELVGLSLLLLLLVIGHVIVQ